MTNFSLVTKISPDEYFRPTKISPDKVLPDKVVLCRFTIDQSNSQPFLEIVYIRALLEVLKTITIYI